jgi:chromosome segregation protein
VFLKSLTLKGFKSFADSTTLDFEPGVTVVVGPNGSGKSNVVDAVAWVLGAQGPRTLRSAKMEDVIFAGTPSRPALGRAEVSLTIDNVAGLLPIDFSEVTITRTLFRTGESEYAINRVPCRLLDIQELLSDTGVGRQQHVIVSQGNLDAILNSRAEDRRLVIEEAAGILKFRRRKEKSERRLEATEASLVRLQDLLREVRRQLRPLEKQAEAARRHDDVVASLAAVRAHLYGRDLGAVEAKLAAAARDRTELARQETDVRAALARLDTGIASAEIEEEAARASEVAIDLAEAVSRAEGQKERAAGLLAVLAERKRGVDRALDATVDQDVIASLEAEGAALTQRLAAVEEEAAQLLPAADDLAVAEHDLEAEKTRVEADWHHEGPVGGDPAGEVRGELAALRAGLERSGSEGRRMETSAQSVRQRVDRLAAESQRLAAVVAETTEAGPELEAAARRDREASTQANASLATAEDERRQADADRHHWSARHEALAQALDEARARAGAKRLAEVGGVVGTLLELVEVDAGYEAAFEAAAGEMLAAVIVDGTGAARKGLAELHRLETSGAVVALGADRPARAGDGTPAAGAGWPVAGWPAAGGAAAGGAEPLRDRVRAVLPAVAALLDELLAGAVVVDGGWEAAVDLAESSPDLLVVTRSGDRCHRGVWRAGSGAGAVTAAALDEARQRFADCQARAGRANEALQWARTLADQARDRATRAARVVDANTARNASAADSLRRTDTDLAEARNEGEVVANERRELASRVERDRGRLAELEGLLPALEAQAEAEAERAAAERAARSRLAERTATVAAMRRELEVRAAGLEERRSLTDRRLAEVEQRLARNVAERDSATARRRQLEDVVVVVDRLITLVRERHQEIDQALLRLRAARRAQTEAARVRVEHLDALRRQRATAERQLSEARERISRLEVDDTEARVRLEATIEAIRRDLDCEPEAVRGAPCPELPPGTSATSRRAELERELRIMGPINPLALEEFQALQERHEFLEAQLEDVRSARRELTKVIRAIDTEIVEVFRAAYADVSEHFETLFATLFPGGQGRLRLTDPEHLLETGIEVEARPSGKNVRRLSLLSGGERSLTAMAFLFAVFRSRPSPFYLMDEVEAALDDVNLHRFLDLVHEFRSEAQLLIVSHQKRTMEAADSLYGVTMAPGGSSRVITERVDQVEELVEARR